MIYRFLLFCFVALSSLAYGQDDMRELLGQGELLAYSQADQALQIGEQILKSNKSDSVNFAARYIISLAHFHQGNYSEAIENLSTNITDEKQSIYPSVACKSHILAAQLANALGFRETAIEFLYSSPSQEKADEINLETRVELSIGKLSVDSIFSDSFLKDIQAQANQLDTALAIQQLTLIKFKFALAEYYAKIGEQALSESQYKRAIQIAINTDYTFLKSALYMELSKIDFNKKHYGAAVAKLLKAEQLGRAFQNAKLMESIYDQMASTYLAMEKVDVYMKYSLRVDSASNLHEMKYYKGINSMYNEIDLYELSLYESEQVRFSRQMKWSLIVAIILMLIAVAIEIWRHVKVKHQKEFERFKQLQQIKKPAKKPARTVAIPKSTELAILEKLERFEAGNKFTSKDMSLALLASQFDTNTKYLSEVINKYKEKNFNQYINDLRVRYVIEKLNTDPIYLTYKVSYLAEESGFSSHSSFATIFKSIAGMSPNTYITFVQEKTKTKLDT